MKHIDYLSGFLNKLALILWLLLRVAADGDECGVVCLVIHLFIRSLIQGICGRYLHVLGSCDIEMNII